MKISVTILFQKVSLIQVPTYTFISTHRFVFCIDIYMLRHIFMTNSKGCKSCFTTKKFVNQPLYSLKGFWTRTLVFQHITNCNP